MDTFRQHPNLVKYNKAIQEDGKSPLFPTKGSSEGGNFNLLYYAFLLGVSSGERETREIAQNQECWPEANKRWPAAFSQYKYVIINLLLVGYATELNTIIEGKTFPKLLHKIVNPNDPNDLSEIGYTRFNQYSYRGFELLENIHPWPTNGIGTFIKINDKLQENFSKSPWV